MTPPVQARHRYDARGAPRIKPRYDRIVGLGIAVITTVVAVGGGIGVIPTDSAQAKPSTPEPSFSSYPNVTLSASGIIDPKTLPSSSGHGRRVVFDQSSQRVWLVGAGDEVARTYLVSGSVTNNLHPGRYEVYSRSRWAVGVDDSGVMQYFVRFAHGPKAAIGFHSIPTKNGDALQTRSQLGTPQSHGCIRQDLPDAIALWGFAPVGTKVVVTA